MTASVTVPMPPERVWAVLGDFGHEARWLSVLSASRRDTPQVGVGTVRTCTLAQPMLGMEEVREELIALEPGRSLTYRTLGAVGPFAYAQARWQLTPVPDGTRIHARASLAPRSRLVGWLVGPLARWRLQRTVQQGLEELAAYLGTLPEAVIL